MKNFFFRISFSRLHRPSRLVGLSHLSRVTGFTLIEIVVTLAVVGLTLGVVVSQLAPVRERDMRRTTNSLASTIRYLYNKAAMEKLYIRLVLDLEERSYWVEATADPFVMAREETVRSNASKAAEEEKKKEEEEKMKAAEEGEAAAVEDGVEEAEEESDKLKPPEPKFSPIDSFLLKPTKLPDTVFFQDLQVEHRRGPVEGGQESIYFFPNGYVERAIINLRDEDDEIHFSLVTHPLSGKVDTADHYQTMGEK